jgi:YgiT-type zinc finger domain-containing protein
MKNKETKCPHCGGNAKLEKKDLQIERDGQPHKFENVSTIICGECGGQFISGKTFSTLNRRTNKLL